MKKIFYLASLLLMAFGPEHSFAQKKDQILSEGVSDNPFEKKFHWGASYNMYWTKITGDDLPSEYFAKPSIGFNFRAEYYFLSFLGVGAGLGYQQQGTGVINTDNSGGAFSHPWDVNASGVQGDPDSTYLQKLRFNTIEVPVAILLRTPGDVLKGVRLSAGAGVNYVYNIKSNDVFQSIVDGFHKETDVTSDYFRNDLAIQLSLGAEFSSGGSGLFQVHFVYAKGTGNVYAAGQGNGNQVTYGVRLAFLL